MFLLYWAFKGTLCKVKARPRPLSPRSGVDASDVEDLSSRLALCPGYPHPRGMLWVPGVLCCQCLDFCTALVSVVSAVLCRD